MEVEIISRETIRPSSPTPSHLRVFTLSLLDQFSPMHYVPFTFFYSLTNDTNNLNVSHLKNSLSKTLSIFYPLAGRIKDHLSIDCNDEGVLFLEARVNCHLSEFLKQPKIDLLDRFHPSLDISMEALKLNVAVVQVAIQVNMFTCGGICIGLCFLHRILDAATIKAFLKCWAAIASGSNDDQATKDPDFKSASLRFPPRESQDDHILLLDASWLLKKEKGIWSRFVFDAESISALKVQVTSEAVPNPTRFEVVTSFIWKHAMDASRALGSSQQPSIMMVAVNLRPKLVPPMSENSIGNIIWQTMAHHKGQESELNRVVDILSGAVKKINGDYGQSLQGDEGFLTAQRSTAELRDLYSNETPEVYTCTSSCSFGFYDVDLGWGEPVWVAFTGGVLSSPMYANSTILMDTKSRDGIEAWVVLPQSQMEKLQCDAEFLTFASLNPSISIPMAPKLISLL